MIHDGQAHAIEVKDEATQTTPPLAKLSTLDLLSLITPEISRLVKDEIALATAELKRDLQRELAMAKLMGIGAILSIFGVAMLFVTIAFALAAAMPAWLAALLVALVLLAAAGISAKMGWEKRVRKPLAETQHTVKDDIEWSKEQVAQD